jgi:phosphatidylserine decarboxylase
MPRSPIRYYDRYRQQYCLEEVYGERALRLAYETPVGRALCMLVFARPFFSKAFGWQIKRPGSRKKIEPFVRQYGLDADEFLLSLDDYNSFNDFFCRELKDEKRPIDEAADSIVFPADGRHMGWQEIGTEEQVFIKGQKWDLSGLLGRDETLIERFSGGSMVLSRLCPVDYHHFHYPVGGRVGDPQWFGNLLFSVSPIALRHNLSYMWRNKRCLNLIETESAGYCCFIEVGATNVGTIKHRPFPSDRRVRKGEPKGWFEFGGSSVLSLFEKGRVALCEDLLQFTSEGTELYAKVGDRMGSMNIH